MKFVLTETWPAASSVDVAKEAVKLAATPPQNMKTLGPFIVMGGDGIKDYTIYEVEKGQADKAFSEIIGRLSGLFRIPGYKASLEVAITQVEALPLVGL
jgi:hypothetical protein